MFILVLTSLIALPHRFRSWLETPVFAATFTVTNTNVSGPGSLRQAMLDANGNPGADIISFNITSGCDVTTNVCTITPTFPSPLPAIVDPVVINGYSQPGASVNTLANGDNAVILIEISGAIVTNNANGLVIATGGAGSTLRGLAIDRGFGIGVQIVDSSSNIIEGCFLGTDASGLVANGNTNGVNLDFGGNSSSNLIGGTTVAARNLISGNGIGVFIRSGTNNMVQGNFIGTDATGINALANNTAIDVTSSNNLIGGSTTGGRNVVAGNGNGEGVIIVVDLAATTGNSIQGNFIGTNAAGTAALGFGGAAVRLGSSTSNTQIGGLTATPGTPPGNVISGSFTGISVSVGVSNNTVQGNLIGTNAAGTAALGNSSDGIIIRGSSNTIGGSTANARNVISGNGRHGIFMGGDNAVSDITIQGNFIGTDITGAALLGNGASGVFVNDTFNNTIGGIVTTPGAPPANVIAGNGDRGVNLVGSTTGIAIEGNSIFSNGNLGIDLLGGTENAFGVTANDSCDIDSGPNNKLQNFPVITTANSVAGNTTVTGTLNSAASTTFRIEFFANSSCDPSGNGEGQTFIGFTTVSTDGSCNASFNVSFPVAVPGGQFITATATDPANNTSEFSNCRFVTSPTAASAIVIGRVADSTQGIEGAVIRLNGTQNRKTITDANGFYKFDNVETNGFYTVTLSRANFSFSPGERSFTQLGNNTTATFSGIATDGAQNPLDTPEYFVRQHYIDFLGREPDEAGFNFWSDQILECGGDTECVQRRRENVSAAYFLSIEFQQTGGLVDGLYRTAYGVRPTYDAFMPDTHTVGMGVVVGMDGWEAKLRANKEAFANSFVNRAAFHAAFDSMSNADYVATLISHTGVEFTADDRAALVSGLTQGTLTRGDALRSIAENQQFVNAKRNETFVMMEYFGYLRRDPDPGGYAFWLNKLNDFNGNFEQAEMVKAFIVSGEFRDRFPR
ncbi:MAG: DUF4214 domain-containing protein [Acidobacteriota bacterium]